MDVSLIFFAVIVAAIILVFGYNLKSSAATGSYRDFKKNRKIKIPAKAYIKPSPINAEGTYAEILEAEFPYYQNLTDKQKQVFIKRVKLFIKGHKFVPNNLPKVTTEMKVLISATAVQLCFGLSDFMFRHVKGFRIYPTAYYSRLIDSNLKGHYLPKGVIFLSYNHFVKGYKDQNDGINLGLHEMAHALHHTYQKSLDYKIFFDAVVKHWFIQAKEGEHIEVPGEVKGFLRKYAATNTKEFFAVCVENFFERPKELQQRLPQVYKHLCFLLNQNPLKIDLGLDKKISEIPEKKAVYKEPVNLFGSVLSIAIPLIYIVWETIAGEGYTNGLTVPATMFACVGILYFMFGTQQIFFFDDHISIRNFIFKSVGATIHNDNILYIASYTKGSGKSSKEVLAFVHYDNGLKETTDVANPSKKFLRAVRQYCQERDLAFVIA